MAAKKKIDLLHPLATLKAHIVALDAAMLVAATAGDVGAVHKLRTGTRRVEAQVRLLDLPGSGAKHEDETNAVRRHLRKVRRAAGAVRDLDVQIEMIRHDAPVKDAVHGGSPGDTVRREAKSLRGHLKHTRRMEADKLVAVLGAQAEKLAAALHALEQALKSEARPTQSASGLQADIHASFAADLRRIFRAKGADDTDDADRLKLAIEGLDADALHDLRKSAKLCRYLAESGPEGSALQGVARQFEAVQEAGGEWHDWLLLTRLARGFHGRKSELALRYQKHRDAALADYRLRLAELLPVLAHPSAVRPA